MDMLAFFWDYSSSVEELSGETTDASGSALLISTSVFLLSVVKDSEIHFGIGQEQINRYMPRIARAPL